MFEKKAKEKYANFLNKVSEILGLNRPVDILRLCAVTDEYFRPIEKQIAELEERIKNQAESLGITLLEEDKKAKRIKELQQENEELKGQVEMSYEVYNDNLDYSHHIEEQLTKAKEIIEELYNIIPASMSDYAKEPMEHARKFMTEE